MFPAAELAQAYLAGKRWPAGTVCPACSEARRITTRKGGYYRCNACLADFTVRTGTIFERSHVQLGGWLHAMHLLRGGGPGPSAAQLAALLGVTPKTARSVMQRLRVACGAAPTDDFDALTAHVLTYRPEGTTQ